MRISIQGLISRQLCVPFSTLYPRSGTFTGGHPSRPDDLVQVCCTFIYHPYSPVRVTSPHLGRRQGLLSPETCGPIFVLTCLLYNDEEVVCAKPVAPSGTGVMARA